MYVKAAVRELLRKSAPVREELLESGRVLDELGADPLALVDLVRKLEARFGISISGEEALGWARVADVVELVEARLGYRAAS
jgi:acyl carrier protein